MKGMVFTEFLEMVEEKFSLELCDSMIEQAVTESDGVYTSVGTYNYKEMVALVDALSALTHVPVSQLLKTFGEHLLGRFVAKFPQFFVGMSSTFDFLPQIERFVHLEVKKLYPDAELPSFSFNKVGPGRMEMTYQSSRGLADVAEGLIIGTMKHFGESLDLKRTDLKDDKSAAIFMITDPRLKQ
ncbi:MAG: heme NO-binding domain-containing protein [bacterium]